MATTVDLGKVRPVWKGAWTANTAYEIHDMVKQDVDSYICTTGHTSGSTFSATNWDYLSQGAQIPNQSGNAGKALVTDGTNMSWGDGGKVLQVQTYLWSSRYTPSATSWNTWYSNTFTKQSASSSIIITASISSRGEHNGYPEQRIVFGNTTSAVTTMQYGNTTYANHDCYVYAITNNTQTGSVSWSLQGDLMGYQVINPNSSDSGDLSGTSSHFVIMEVIQ